MQILNQLNFDGQRNGPWEEYYGDNKLRYKGNYLNDKRHGSWESFRPSGIMWYKGKFNNGKKIGYCQFFSFDGTLQESKFYAN
jgi:uncharacterized protein